MTLALSNPPKTKLATFYEFSNANHLDKWMGGMDKLNQREGFCPKFRARSANSVVAGMNLTGLFFNILKAPLVIATLPLAALLKISSGLIGRIVRLTDVSTEQATTRRKLTHVIPKIMKYTPSILDLARSILNIVKYAIAFFSSLLIGFISVNANIWIHHKLGLVCNPDMAKQDRKHQVISYTQGMEGRSIKNIKAVKHKEFLIGYRGPGVSKIDKRAEEIRRVLVVGDNQRVEMNTNSFVYSLLKNGNPTPIVREDLALDDDNMIKEAIEKATQEKRERSKTELENKLERSLTAEELDEISFKYYRQLQDPFDFNKLGPQYKEFLSKYFNFILEIDDKPTPKNREFLSKFFNFALKTDNQALKTDNQAARDVKKYFSRPCTFEEVIDFLKVMPQAKIREQSLFKSKVLYDEYMKGFCKWNLTDEKETDKIKDVVNSISKSRQQKTAAYAQAENEIVEQKRKMNRNIIEKENEIAEMDRRFTSALIEKKAEFKKKLSEEKKALTTQIHALNEVEKRILKETEKDGHNLSEEEVLAIKECKGYNFSDVERKALVDFASKAMEYKHKLKERQSERSKWLKKTLQAKKDELKHEYSNAIVALNLKISTALAIEKEIVRATKDNGCNLAEKDVDNIINKGSKVLIKHGDKFTSEERIALQTFASTAFETNEQNELELVKNAKRRQNLMPTEHYFEIKNRVSRQLQREYFQSKFVRPIYDLKTAVNVDKEILERVQVKIDADINACTAKMRQEAKEEALLNGQTVNEDLLQSSIEKMGEHYLNVETPRLYEQLLQEKIFPTLEKERAIAFQKIKDVHYDFKDAEKKYGPKKEIIQTFIYRKSNKENKPSVRSQKRYAKESDLLNKRCKRLPICLKFPQDDFDSDIKVIFEGLHRIPVENGYIEGPIEFTYHELDKLVSQRKKVFEQAARRYKNIKHRVEHKHFTETVLTVVGGFEELQKRAQQKSIQDQFKDELLTNAFGEQSNQFDRAEKEILALRKENNDLRERVNDLRERVLELEAVLDFGKQFN